ncbi:MAG: hypothetical protein GKR87_00655 [Kiritimatiellae bacterium]|nr:hypothetical protein [Kiritimatiellia bacterium]
MTAYVYDEYNRPVAVTDSMGNVATYHYDDNHNRVSEQTDGELTDLIG